MRPGAPIVLLVLAGMAAAGTLELEARERKSQPTATKQVITRTTRPMERGVASWYGRQFHGKRTASGETFDMFKMTAAHRTLPLGSKVKVRNPRNGKSVVVLVNDRGPYAKNRIIDLSYSAAKELGIARAGTAIVEIRPLKTKGKA